MRRFCYLVVLDECALKIFAKVGETQTAWVNLFAEFIPTAKCNGTFTRGMFGESLDFGSAHHATLHLETAHRPGRELGKI